MPTVAHSARISSLDLKRGPSGVGFIMRYHSSQTAPGMRPLRGQKSSPYGKDFCPRKGRIPGAVWLEWYRMMKPTAEGPRFKSKEEILAECATVGISQNTPVYLYCFKGARASNTFLALKNAGVKDVRMYFGSWNEWSRDPSLPIEEGLPTDARLTEKAA